VGEEQERLDNIFQMFMILHERGVICIHFTYDVCCRYRFNIQRAIIHRTLRGARSIDSMFLPTDNGEPSPRDWLLGWLFGTESELSENEGSALTRVEGGSVEDDEESGATSGEDSAET
jgi:hypothetical protein